MAFFQKKDEWINTGIGVIVLPALFSGCVTKKDISSYIQINDFAPVASRVNEGKYFLLKGTPRLKNHEYCPVSDRITGQGQATKEELAEYLIMHNPGCGREEALDLAGLYIREAETEGINSDVAFVQMCLETGYLRFTGTVTPDQNNFCGLGTVSKTVKGASFQTAELGVRAHIQHLKAYGSINPTNNKLVDPRFGLVNRGCAEDIYDLTGKWADDPRYGEKLDSMLGTLDGIIFQNRDIAGSRKV